MPKFAACSLWLGVLAAAGSLGRDSLAPRHEQGSELTRTIEEDTTWGLDTLSLVMDDSPVEQGLPDVEGHVTRRIVLVDRLREVGEGRLRELARRFDELAAASDVQVDDGETSLELETESASELADQQVVFTWDEADEAYSCAYDEGSSGPPGLLEGLVLECDLAAFLPPREVEPGETWEVAPAALAQVLKPSGELALLPVHFTPGSLLTVPSGIIVATGFAGASGATGELAGEIRAEYAGTEEQDGVRVARVELELEVTTEADRSAHYRAALERAELPADAELSLELELDGTGVLLWDVERGRALSFELEGEIVLSAELAWEETLMNETVEMSGDIEVSGTTRLSARYE